MRVKLYFITVFFLVGIYTTQAQITDNNIWTEYCINIQNRPFVVAKRQYWTAGDTIINGQTYKKVVENKDTQYNGTNGYIGAIREDNGKVYAILWPGDGEWEEEFLLYDYTVQVEDMIISTAPAGELSYPLTVTQRDEITLENGEKRKQFFLDHAGPWIEGIGSIYGLFADAMWHATNYNVWYLVCFKQGDEILYRNEEWCQTNDCCADIGDDVSVINTLSDIRTIMTQNNNQIILNFPETFSEETAIRLFDATGHIVFTKTTTQGSSELNISDYPHGIYLISIRNGNNVECFKFKK